MGTSALFPTATLESPCVISSSKSINRNSVFLLSLAIMVVFKICDTFFEFGETGIISS